MLSDYSLDTENFRDIMENAKNMAASIYPEWTDYNYHDPGITMLELLAWIKEGQQFFLDQIGDEHRKKYLKLLGTRQRHAVCARANVILSPVDEVFLQGTKLYARDVCFETEKRRYVTNMLLRACMQEREGKIEEKRRTGDLRRPLHIRMFDEQSQGGDCFYIVFRESLDSREVMGIYFSIAQMGETKRNPLTEALPYPMLTFEIEIGTAEGYQRVEIIEDDTMGFLQSGSIYFYTGKEMEKMAMDGVSGYFLRIRAVMCELDAPVVLDSLETNVVPVVQKDTWVTSRTGKAVRDGNGFRFSSDHFLDVAGRSEVYVEKDGVWHPVPVHEKSLDARQNVSCFRFQFDGLDGVEEVPVLLVSDSGNKNYRKRIADGNGFPHQEYELHSQNVVWEDLRILVRDLDSMGFVEWERVEDFGSSKPSDRHFMVDEEQKLLRFGDCIHGMAPEGDILLISFAETLGEQGNVKAGRINEISGIDKNHILVENPDEARGGRAMESISECFQRVRRELGRPDTAVTDEDYERYIKNTPGLMIEHCKVISMEETTGNKRKNMEQNTRHVVVKPGGGRDIKKLSDIYRKNILHYMEKYRLLGTRLVLSVPVYIVVELCIDLVLKPHYVQARKMVKDAVEEYFAKWQERLGGTMEYSELYGVLDMLEAVECVNELTIELKEGNARCSEDGSVILPPDGMLRLGHAAYMFTLSDE